MMGISIVDASTGSAPSTLMLVVRYLAYIISALPLGLGFIWVAIDKRKQGFHDKIGNTVVIENPPKDEDADDTQLAVLFNTFNCFLCIAPSALQRFLGCWATNA